MSNLVPDDHADGAVIDRVVSLGVKEPRLQDAGRELPPHLEFIGAKRVLHIGLAVDPRDLPGLRLTLRLRWAIACSIARCGMGRWTTWVSRLVDPKAMPISDEALFAGHWAKHGQ